MILLSTNDSLGYSLSVNINKAKKQAADITGLELVMNCGMKVRCVAYRNNRDIDVEFEDGFIVRGRSKIDFLKGKIYNPSTRKSYVGTVVLQSCGKSAECIAYRGSCDVDIRFDDGVIVRQRVFRAFLRGEIRHPSFYSEYEGQSLTYNDGRPCTCIAYRSSSDIDVEFEDGSKLLSIQSNMLTGWKKVHNSSLSRVRCLGVSIPMKCGLTATCVAYRDYKDIDIQFEDGVIVMGTYRTSFYLGR